MSSSSSSKISATTVNGTTRYTGLSSGIDVDTIVTQLMTAEKAKKLNKLEQKEQLAEWKQDAYRDITSDIQTFSSKYFDLTSDSSLLSTSTWEQYSSTSSSSAVSATYTSDASAGSHTVTVSQLATAETLKSSTNLAGDVTADSALTTGSWPSMSGKSIYITVDGTQSTVSLDSVTDLTSLQSAIDDAVGSGKLSVNTTTDGYLTITGAEGVGSITLSDPSSNGGLSDLGFGSRATLTNRLDTSSDTLADISGLTFNSDNETILTVNGTEVTLKSSYTIDEAIDAVKEADCGATLSYDENTGKLVLTADSTGAADSLTVTESGGNFLDTCLGTETAGTDSIATIDGEKYVRSSNTITVNGVKYTFNAKTDDTDTVSLALDTDGIYDTLSNFVDDYNSLIATINNAIDEKYDSDYPPLTDDQKDSMTDTQISNYEEKAKKGLLEKDSLLTSFLSDLRSAVVDPISNMSTTIFDFKITTGDYDTNGKLVLGTEAKVKAAIESDPDALAKLFSQESSTYSDDTKVTTSSDSAYDADELATRYNEEGIAYRFYDILAKYTSTTYGKKGLLLEKAGISGDTSSTNNTLSDQISKYEEEITKEEDRLSSYEDRIYNQYTNLETYINNMNTQLSALQSYLSSSS